METLEAGDTLNNASDNVQLLLGTLIVVPLPLEPDPDPTGRRSDTSGPDGLVKTGGDTNIVNAHRLLGKLDNLLNGLGGLLLEGEVVHSLVEVDGVLPGDDVVESGSGSSGLNITVSKAHALIVETAGRKASGLMVVRCQIVRRYPVLISNTPATNTRLPSSPQPSRYQYASALLPAFCHVEFRMKC